MSALELGAPVTVTARLQRRKRTNPDRVKAGEPDAVHTWETVTYPQPVRGLVIGRRTLRNGRRWWSYDAEAPGQWEPTEAVPALLVVTAMGKAPVYVPPDAVTPIAPAPVDPDVVGYYCSHEHEPYGARSHVDRHGRRGQENTTRALQLPEHGTGGPPPCPLAQPVRVVVT